MAKSLKCGECGKLLGSVKEAQNHNEITGHVQFEETTEVVKVQRCTACGKPARSEAERHLHTRFTGHQDFTEVALDAELDTEKQMKDAREEIGDEELILGKNKRASTEEASKQGASTSTYAGEAGTSSAQGNMVSPTVDDALVSELVGMGFGRERSVRAAYHTEGGGVEAAVGWLADHEKDADIDTPLMVTQASEDTAAKLTPEERKRKAQELMKAAKDKREKEERELAAHRERERIRAGKELLLAKKQEDGLALKRMVEQRRLEKEEEARAKEKIRVKLEEDRRERRRKLGLPEELTPEELAKEAERAAAAAKEAEEKKKNAVWTVKPVTVLEKLRNILVGMKKTHVEEEDKWRTAAATMIKYIANVVAHPAEEKYRSIKTTNAAFSQKVAVATGAIDFLEVCGFQREGEMLVLSKDKLNLEVLNGAGGLLTEMQTNQFFGLL